MHSFELTQGNRVSFHDWNEILDVTIESIEPGNRITVKSESGDFFLAEVVRDYHGPKFQNATLKSLVSPELRYKGRKALDRYLKGGVFEENRR